MVRFTRFNCLTASLAAVLSVGPLAVGPAFAKGEIVFASTGGSFEEALRRNFFAPFEQETGIKVISASATDSEQRTKATAMKEAGNTSWDVIINTEIWAASPNNRSFAQDLTEFCAPYAQDADLIAGTCSADAVKLSVNPTLLAYNTDEYKDYKPASWADFWDTEKFEGERGLPNFSDPWRIYAAALLADGVEKDKIFPIDVERALKKLNEIRPSVSVWWKTGDQSQRGFREGEYTMAMIWNTRANAMKAAGEPVEVVFEDSFLLADSMQVLADGPNKENALKLIAWVLKHPEAQAKFAEAAGVIPVSAKAVSLMSDEAKAKMPTDMKKVVLPNADWINENQASMLEAWNKWIQE